VAKQTEVRLRDVIIWFDGTILEVFDPTEKGSVRFLPETFDEITLDGDFLTIIHQVGEARSLYWVEPEQRGQVGELVDAVKAAAG
jgi:hypothetical protein